MVYLKAYGFNTNSEMWVTLVKSEDNKEIRVDTDDKIREVVREINKQNIIHGLKLVGQVILVHEYNEELIKIIGISKGTEVGLKFHYRNWISAKFMGNNDYEYAFSIQGETFKLSREYMRLQDVKIDMTEKYKSETKECEDVPLDKLFPQGLTIEKPLPSKEEMRIEQERKRRELEERRRKSVEADEKRKAEEREKAKLIRQQEKQREKEESDRRYREAKAEAVRRKIAVGNKPNEVKKETVNNKVTKRFRVISPEELQRDFTPNQVYRGFTILKSNVSDDIAVAYIKDRPLYAQTIKTYVNKGGKIVVPFTTVSLTREWIKNEFY